MFGMHPSTKESYLTMSPVTGAELARSLEPLGVAVPSAVPTHWYNLTADLPEPVPPHLHPGTREPLGPEDLAPLFPASLIEQEVATDRYIEIPETVREIYGMWRPSPLVRAHRLERVLGTPARIYYKYEGVSPVGSHKPNTAVAQAYYNALEGTTKLTTETGAGQWGASLSFAGALLGLDVEVWQVRASYDAKPYRRLQMEAYGGICHPSPSDLTEAGRAILAEHPDTTGSLGMAISEAVEVAAKDPRAHYSLGSVLNHVMLHQTVIGQEAMAQLEEAGEPVAHTVFGCAGGGSNLAGLTFPFLGRNLREGTTTRLVACEPAACPSLTQGEYRYDFGDVAGLTPLLKMYTLGNVRGFRSGDDAFGAGEEQARGKCVVLFDRGRLRQSEGDGRRGRGHRACPHGHRTGGRGHRTVRQRPAGPPRVQPVRLIDVPRQTPGSASAVTGAASTTCSPGGRRRGCPRVR